MKQSRYTLAEILIILLSLISPVFSAQTDSLKTVTPADTSASRLNMDAIYNRPFLLSGKAPVAIGGYLEANTEYASTDGISDGMSFQMRRMTLFVSSSMAKRIRFMSELELENGTEEINLEYCAMDVDLASFMTLRGGIIMNPIGAYNQNHDGPRWDFIDRPLSATDIIPTTLSNVGMGIHGKYFTRKWIFGYEFYLTNGFNDRVIDNEAGRTSLMEGKEGQEKFSQSNSGLPMYTGKVAIRNRDFGELGFSYMTGVYNRWKIDGLIVDDQRSATVFAIDYSASLLKGNLTVTGEYADARIDVPADFTQQYGSRQQGFYTDLVWSFLQRKVGQWEKAKFNIGIRAEYVDRNVGNFTEPGSRIGDETAAITPSLSFRPTGTTVVRFNFRFEKERDLLYNPASRTNKIQFGFSSYF